MATAYLIGGAPRVGKTTLAMRVIARHPMFAVSADAVRDVLQGVLKPATHPDLFEMLELSRHESAMAKFLDNHPYEGVTMQNDESAIVWPSINQFIQTHLSDGQDILVEGVEILPEWLTYVTYDYKIVFLGNTSADHANQIAMQAHLNQHDWMHRYTDNSIASWAGLVREFSRYVKGQAAEHDMPFIETNDDNLEASMREAERVLLDQTSS